MRKILLFILIIFPPVSFLHPQVIDFTCTPSEACDSARVKFTSTVFLPDTSSLSIQWTFGNGTSYSTNRFYKINPPQSILYSAPGSYTVTLSITNKNGTFTKIHTIHIYQSPNPFFHIYDTVAASDYAYTYVLKVAEPILPDTCYLWLIENIDTLRGHSFSKTFPAEGAYPVQLVVTDTSNLHCQSSYKRTLYAFKELNIPDLFMPHDPNPKNNIFYVETNGTNIYRLSIFSRSGLLIYQSEGTTIVWDGYLYSGELVQPGIYFYIIENLSAKSPHQDKGFLYVLY